MVSRRLLALPALIALLVLGACAAGGDTQADEPAPALRPATDPGTLLEPVLAPVDESAVDPAVASMEYQVGDTGPAGGVVFYVSAEGFACGPDLASRCNYLEAAPGSSEVRRGWADTPRLELAVDGADDSAIGAGWANTLDIVALGNTDPMTSAAAYADAYEFGGFDDWYLPAKDEFNELYEQRDMVGGFSGADYWSSSEVSSDMAWSHYFHQGHPMLPHPKNHYTHLIRPVRAF